MSERIRNSIVIRGINSAEPCHTVDDGAMTDIFNLRYKNRTFENVSEPIITYPITSSNDFIILHSMDILPNGQYIAHANDELHLVKVANGVVTSLQNIGSVNLKDLNVTHFGNVLFANYKIGSELNEQCWIYKSGTFNTFSLNNLDPPSFEVTYERKIAPRSGKGPMLIDSALKWNLILKRNMQESGDISYSLGDEYEYGIPVSELQDADYIVGNFIIMLAYKLFDGSIVKCSKPIAISSYKSDIADEDGLPLARVKYHAPSNNTFEVYFYDIIRGVKASVNLLTDLPKSNIIKSVVILSTRAQIPYDYENIHTQFGTGGVDWSKELEAELEGPFMGSWPEDHYIHKYYRDIILYKDYNHLFQPFYEIAEFDADKTQITLNYNDHYKHITNEDIHKASYSLHSVLSKGKYEYNNRLHSFGISLKPFSGYNLAASTTDSYLGSYARVMDIDVNYDVQLLIDSQDYTIRNTTTTKVAFYKAIGSGKYSSAGIVLNTPVVYPDVRAKSIMIWFIYNGRQYHHNMTLKCADANNMAYFEMPNSNKNFIDSFAKIELSGSDFHFRTEAYSGFIEQSNKLYVSAQNNPFVVMPSNIYSVGNSSCIIDSVDTATEQITETKFGMFPLNAFTNKGIYAIETGSGEVLYQSVVGLSNDIKIPNTTTVGASNLVFFISERGVMAIQGRQVECISTQLDRYVSLRTGLDDFNKYIIEAKLTYNPVEMELMVHNSTYNYAYIFALNGKFWSRRSWDGRPISGVNNQIIVASGIASTWNEDRDKPVRLCSLESRALKFGSLEFKRIDTLVARLSSGANSYYEIWLYGSNNLENWASIGKCENTTTIRRTGASFRYFKVVINCTVLDYFAITNFDVEFYNRFVRRLR